VDTLSDRVRQMEEQFQEEAKELQASKRGLEGRLAVSERAR